MFTTNTIVQLKSSLSGNTRTVPFRACGKVVAVYPTGGTATYKVKFFQGEFDVPHNQLELAPKHVCLPVNVTKFKDWLQNRGGLVNWNSANLSDPCKTWTGPLNDANGNPVTKPDWQAGEITRHITDPDEVVVEVPKEIKRFHVAVRRGSQGFTLKLTDASTKRLRVAVAKISRDYNKEAWYDFSYSTQEAVIFIAGSETPLNEWKE